MEQTKTPYLTPPSHSWCRSFRAREALRGAFPSDEECAVGARQRTVRHFLGRGKSQSEDVDLPKINAELFAKIRTDKDGRSLTMPRPGW